MKNLLDLFHFKVFSFFFPCNLRASLGMQILFVARFYRATFFFCLFSLSLFRFVSFIFRDSLHSPETVNREPRSSSNSIVMTVRMQSAQAVLNDLLSHRLISRLLSASDCASSEIKAKRNDKKQTKSLTSSKTKRKKFQASTRLAREISQ